MRRLLTLLLPLLFCVSAQAQTFCDSLFIENVSFDLFDDSTIIVDVSNQSSQIFSYPAFVLLNDQGDTLAKEVVNYFGIGNSQTHILQVLDTSVSAQILNARLQLWVQFYDTVLCEYNMEVNLCPDSCFNLYPFIANYGGAININSYFWSILDDDSITVANGIFELTNQNQFDQDTICLTVGDYTMKIEDYIHTGGQIWTGMNMNSLTGFSYPAVQSGFSKYFRLFQNCPSGINSIESLPSNSHFEIIVRSNSLSIFSKEQSKMERITMLDSGGRIVYTSSSHSFKHEIDISKLNSGMYFLWIENSLQKECKRFFKF
ncbi:MAG: hypothetical protein HKN92_06390 [Chitinophagales bacterium]|nr:hypothetical protein [Chitinophagales bacterium]